MTDKPTRPLPAVQLADLEAHCRVMGEWDRRHGHRALWVALGRLVSIVAAVVRRLPPES